MSNNLQLKRGLQSALPIGLSGELLFTTDTKRLYLSDGSANNLLQGSDSIFTTGSIPFSNSSGKLTTDSSNFYWDDTNNRLGIGTATPAVTFDVTGIGRITNGARFNNVGIAYGPWGQNPLEIGTNGSHFIIQATNGGNTSINSVVDLGAKLGIKVGGAAITDIALRIRDSGNTVDLLTVDGTGALKIKHNTFTGTMSFAQTANSTSVITGGPASENITFGPSNRIFLNASQVVIGFLHTLGTINSTALSGSAGNSLAITSNSSFVGSTGLLQNHIKLTSTVAQQNVSPVFNALYIEPTINNTTTTTAIARGIYYNPILTSLTGTTHIALETVTGDVIFGSTSGNVGIKTSTPFLGSTGAATGIDIGIFNSAGNESNLMVRGFASLGGISRSSYGAVGSNYYLDAANALKRRQADSVSVLDFVAGAFLFKTAGNGAANSAIGLSETMRLTATGNLGIANTNPSFPLVVGTNTAGTGSDFSVQPSTSAAKLTLSSQSATMSFGANPQGSYTNGVPPGASFGSTTAGSSTTVGCLLTAAGGGTYVNFSTNGASSGFHITHNFGADLVTVLSNGNFGIGTTTPTGKLEVLATTALPVIIGDSATANFGKIYPNAGGNLTILANGNSGKTLLLNGGNGSNLELKASYDQNGSYNFTSNNYTSTSITGYVLGIHGASIAVASVGTGTPRIVGIDYTINNTGAQTGTATGIFLNATETALNGMVHNLMDLQVGGVSKFRVSNVGGLIISSSAIFSGALEVGLNNIINWSGRTTMASQADGNLLLRNSNFTTFGLLQLGGTTNLFPAIKRNGAGIDFRLADDSAGCNITANNFTSTVNSATFGMLTSSYGSFTGSSNSGFLEITETANNKIRINTGTLVFNSTINCFNGTTNLFPAIGRSSTALTFILADNSGYAQYVGRLINWSTALKNSASNLAAGLIVYDTTLNKLSFYNGTTWETVTSV